MRTVLLAWLLACSGASESESAAESEPESASESAAESEAESEPESASEPGSASEPETGPAPESELEPPPEPGTLRFVVIPEGPELLGSERRELDELRASLGRGRTLDGTEATDAERAWTGETPLPGRWRRFETVVVLRVAEPRTLRRRGRRMSQGLRSVHVLRPPSTEAAYTLEGEPVALDAEKESEWLGALLGALDEGESP